MLRLQLQAGLGPGCYPLGALLRKAAGPLVPDQGCLTLRITSGGTTQERDGFLCV